MDNIYLFLYERNTFIITNICSLKHFWFFAFIPLLKVWKKGFGEKAILGRGKIAFSPAVLADGSAARRPRVLACSRRARTSLALFYIHLRFRE